MDVKILLLLLLAPRLRPALDPLSTAPALLAFPAPSKAKGTAVFVLPGAR
jgi:hypothetical protein